MGHAGAIVSGGTGTAAEKMAAFQAVGVPVARIPSEIPALVAELMSRRRPARASKAVSRGRASRAARKRGGARPSAGGRGKPARRVAAGSARRTARSTARKRRP
jgi:hypothetical protein